MVPPCLAAKCRPLDSQYRAFPSELTFRSAQKLTGEFSLVALPKMPARFTPNHLARWGMAYYSRSSLAIVLWTQRELNPRPSQCH